MAEVFYFHVQEDRSIKYKLPEPIMQEDKDVATWRFRIPKILNEIDMSAWSWWFVYVNAKGQTFSELLTLTDDIDEPSSYSTADYNIDYGISKFPGSFSFALEAISTEQGGEISGEWHTKTYKHRVDSTLQGNQAEYAETESDIISALLEEVRTKMNQIIGGATPTPVASVSQMTDTSKLYLLTTDGEWYYYNGTAWVSGGVYGAGVVDSTPTQGSTNAVSSGGVYESINEINGDINDLKSELKHTNNDAYSIMQSKVIPLKLNSYIDLSGSSIQMTSGVPVETGYSQTFSYGLFPCSEGDIFTINGVGGNSTRLWGFVDSIGNILSVSSRNAKAKGYLLVAPKNASWIIVHTNEDSVSFYGESLIYKVNALLPNNSIDNASYIHVVDAENLEINLTLESGNNKTIYVTGNNLCDNQAKNVAIAAPNIVAGSDYRSLIVPIKGGEIYTVSRTAKVTNRFRAALTVDYPADGVSIVGTVITADNSLSFVLDTTSHPEAKYVVIYLSNSGESISTADYQVEFGYIKTNYEPYNAQVIVTDETSATVIPRTRNANIWCDTGKISSKYYRKAEQYEAQKFSPINTGNISIVCAKEHRYTDGTQAVVEGYLVEECGTKKFFFTKDFANYKYMFTAHIETYKYSFGMLANGDVIACKMAEMLPSAEKSDENRENPYCWLASETWSIEHEIDFGLGLKPCGWLENCGFKVISNGRALFGEYTRANMATANVWEIIGDPSSRWNWKVRKSFNVTSVDNITGFKHIHMVEQDCYTGVVYVSTGDDNDNSMMWYSTDSGATWTQLGASNEKYCRNLSITFTKDYVYWVPDTPVQSKRYLFKAVRNSNGIIDIENIDDYIALNSDVAKGIASYGATYIMPYECMLILDRCDGDATEMELTIANLTDGTLHTIAKIESATGSAMHIGFRTRYSEFISRTGVIHFGFGFQDVNVVNHNKGFDNKGYDMTGGGIYNINNIVIIANKIGEQFKAIFDTIV